MSQNEFVDGKDHVGISRSLHDPKPQFEFVGAQAENRVVEFTSHSEGPPLRSCSKSFFGRLLDSGSWSTHSNRSRARCAVALHIYEFVVQAGIVRYFLQR